MSGSENKDLYSVTKKDKVISFTGKWMGLESIVVGEISPTWKDKQGCFLRVVKVKVEGGLLG